MTTPYSNICVDCGRAITGRMRCLQCEYTHRRLYPAMLGKRHSPQTIEKIRQSNLGMKRSLITRERCRQAQLQTPNHFWRGRTKPSEWRAKISGKNHPRWKGGVSILMNGIRKALEYKQMRKAVYERDDYTCQKCGIRGGLLHPHHIVKELNWLVSSYNITSFDVLREYANEIFDIVYCVTIHEKCHKPLHGKQKVMGGISNGTL